MERADGQSVPKTEISYGANMRFRGADLTGKRFGRLIVIGRDTDNRSKHDHYWLCKCDCGNMKSVTTGHLTAGTVTSCGCLRKERAIKQFQKAAKDKITHGETHTTLYNIWHLMKQRCTNPNASGFKWYGAKGVNVCDEWQEYENFAKWAYSNGYEDIQNLPRAQRLSIDRIDSDGDYCPENCRFVTISENSRRACEKRRKNAII